MRMRVRILSRGDVDSLTDHSSVQVASPNHGIFIIISDGGSDSIAPSPSCISQVQSGTAPCVSSVSCEALYQSGLNHDGGPFCSVYKIRRTLV